MRTQASLWVAFSGLTAFTANACDDPPVIRDVPDGATATIDQMRAAQTTVKTYIAAMEMYRACLEEELKAKGTSAPQEFKTLMLSRIDTADKEMGTIAEAFNTQRAAYVAAHPKTNN